MQAGSLKIMGYRSLGYVMLYGKYDFEDLIKVLKQLTLRTSEG